MYKIKRFSKGQNMFMGGVSGAVGGLALAGKLGIKSSRATGAMALGGAALGAGLGAYLSQNKTYTPSPQRKNAQEDQRAKDVLNSIVLPNLPKEYNNLKKFAEGAKKIEKMYYEAQDDWELDTILWSPEDIARFYSESSDSSWWPGKDYMRVLEFGCQDDLNFYYNFKEKSWYYDSRNWELNKNYPRLVKAVSFKKPIIKLYELELKRFSTPSDKEEFADYIRYVQEMIKYTKSSNLK